jgi:hypothetical protein
VKEARKLGKILDSQNVGKASNRGNFDVMALFDGGSLARQKIWLKVLTLINMGLQTIRMLEHHCSLL